MSGTKMLACPIEFANEVERIIEAIQSGKLNQITTAEYLGNIITRITLVGALFLGLLAVLPLILQGLTGITVVTIGGTALLIVVSVVLDVIKKVDAQTSIREY